MCDHVVTGVELSKRGDDLTVFGVSLSHMSGWRDVQEAGKQIRHRLQWKAAQIVGVDRAWINGKWVMVVMDLGVCTPVALDFPLFSPLCTHGWLNLPTVSTLWCFVGVPGFEPGTSRTRTVRSSRAEPHPVAFPGGKSRRHYTCGICFWQDRLMG